MKTSHGSFSPRRCGNSRPSLRAGYGLLEILGGLAIITVLAAIAVSQVVQARRSAGVNSVVQTITGLQAALHNFSLNQPAGLVYPPITAASVTSAIPCTGSALQGASASTGSKAATLDQVLIAEGALASPVNVGIGTGANTPAGTLAHPLVWTPSAGSFSCTGNAVPDYDYSNVPRCICQMSTTAVPGTDGSNFYLDASQTAMTSTARVVSLVIPNVQGTVAALLANTYDNVSTATATTARSIGRVTYAIPTAAGLTTVYVYVAQY